LWVLACGRRRSLRPAARACMAARFVSIAATSTAATGVSTDSAAAMTSSASIRRVAASAAASVRPGGQPPAARPSGAGRSPHRRRACASVPSLGPVLLLVDRGGLEAAPAQRALDVVDHLRVAADDRGGGAWPRVEPVGVLAHHVLDPAPLPGPLGVQPGPADGGDVFEPVELLGECPHLVQVAELRGDARDRKSTR